MFCRRWFWFDGATINRMSLSTRFCVLFWLWFAISGAVAQTSGTGVGPVASAIRAKEFDKALELLAPALQHSPTDAQLWSLRGLALTGKGQTKQAMASFQSALKYSPDYLPALEGAAQIEYQAGNKAAIPLLRHVLRLRPDDLTSHAMLATLAYKDGDCATAVEHFERSGSLLASQPSALQEYGACLVSLKQAEKAIAVFQQLLARHTDDSRVRRSLAAVQLAAGHPQDALATLEPLLQAGEGDAKTLEVAAAVYEANKDTPHAGQMLRQAIVVEPRDTDLYVQFADLCYVHQSFQAGVDMINAGLRLQADAAALYLARGVLYVQLADFQSAEADFEKAEQLDPHQSVSSAALGLQAQEMYGNDPDQALATVRAQLSKRPDSALLWNTQASILADKGPSPDSAEFQLAVQSARKAVTLQPSLSSAHNILARLYLQAEQPGPAIEECREALRHSPNDQSALYHLIVALRKTGQMAEIPGLLQRLAQARRDATNAEAENYRYKLVIEPEVQPNPSPQ